MNEAAVSSKLRVALNEAGAKADKVSDRFHACRPDLSVCHCGRTIVIETKIHPNVPTFGQAHELTEYVQHGAQAYVLQYNKADKRLLFTRCNDGLRMPFFKFKDAAQCLLQQSCLLTNR